ncbi:MAG: DUF1858 domain-containing protein [Acidobacteria bacterium]|nr:DUF1858 domain-containing protein [Acidobacteriota bacterium]
MTEQKNPAMEITPETRVGPLLDRYPELEAVLIGLSPAFARLRNPMLRRTVAKVATLQQAARIGGIAPSQLIRTLRDAAGLDAGTPVADETGGPEAAAPGWFRQELVVIAFDARPLIDSGGQPLGRAMTDLAALGPGEVYELLTPFLPAPLLDKAKEKGFASWTRRDEEGIFHNYFCRSG